MPFEYLAILIIVLLVTIFLERVYKVHLYRNRKERIEIAILFFLIGSAWDTFAIWRGHWYFAGGGGGLLGIEFGLMSLEEYLFVLILPYFVITLYKLVDSKFRRRKFD